MKTLVALLLALSLTGCGGGSGPTPSSGNNVCDQSNPANIAVRIAPDTVTLSPNASQVFTPVLSFCVDSQSLQHLTWTVQEIGGGLIVPTFPGANSQTYIAPAAPGTYHVLLTYRFSGTQTKTGTATITVR